MRRDVNNMALRVLRGVDWLKDYPPELAEALLANGRLVRLNPGEWAQAEGDERGGLFVVIDGLFHTYCEAPGDREVLIGHSEAGAVLGHATRFSGGPRIATAVSAEPSILLEVSEAALERIAGQHPEIWRAIAGFAYANMRNAVRMAAEVISLPPRQRLAARLLTAAAHRQTAGPPIIRLNQQMLAEMVGLTRKTVNQHLAAFERDGLVRTGYGSITLCDLDRLRAVANA